MLNHKVFKTNVGNQVSEIEQLTKSCRWKHVSTSRNPADFISRGQTPHQFANHINWQTDPQ